MALGSSASFTSRSEHARYGSAASGEYSALAACMRSTNVAPTSGIIGTDTAAAAGATPAGAAEDADAAYATAASRTADAHTPLTSRNMSGTSTEIVMGASRLMSAPVGTHVHVALRLSDSPNARSRTSKTPLSISSVGWQYGGADGRGAAVAAGVCVTDGVLTALDVCDGDAEGGCEKDLVFVPRDFDMLRLAVADALGMALSDAPDGDVEDDAEFGSVMDGDTEADVF